MGIKHLHKFKLGQIVATPAAIEALNKSIQSPLEFLQRHKRADWGDICESDKILNDEAIKFEGDLEKQQRVLSSYKTNKGEVIWIITEWDRSVTTILLPSDY